MFHYIYILGLKKLTQCFNCLIARLQRSGWVKKNIYIYIYIHIYILCIHNIYIYIRWKHKNYISKTYFDELGIKLDNNKYNQKLPYIYNMTKCMAKILWQKVVICHPLFDNINMWKLLVIMVVICMYIKWKYVYNK